MSWPFMKSFTCIIYIQYTYRTYLPWVNGKVLCFDDSTTRKVYMIANWVKY